MLTGFSCFGFNDITLSSFLLFSLVLHLVRVSVTTGSIRRYLDSTEVARVVQMLHDGTSICAIGRSFVVSQHGLMSTEEIPGDRRLF